MYLSLDIMASYQIPAIKAFDFNTPTEKVQGSGITEKSEESQIDTLIYSMGIKQMAFYSHLIPQK